MEDGEQRWSCSEGSQLSRGGLGRVKVGKEKRCPWSWVFLGVFGVNHLSYYPGTEALLCQSTTRPKQATPQNVFSHFCPLLVITALD